MPDFKDIPQFIHGGNYACDVPFDYLQGWLDGQRRDGQIVDLDPDFQRGHVWNDEQRSRFVEFILRGGQSSYDIRWNHPTWSASPRPEDKDYKPRDLPEVLTIVDGLQRLTAVLKFMNNEIPAFGYLRKEYTGWMRHYCRLRMHVNNLQTRADLLQWYIDLNDGGVVHSPAEIRRVRKLLKEAENGQAK